MSIMAYQNNKAVGDASTRPPLTTTSNDKDLIAMATHQLSLFPEKSQDQKNPAKKNSSIIGKRFGRLVVQEFSHIGKRRKAFFKCICDCGEIAVVSKSNLSTGNTKSCGCFGRQNREENLQGNSFRKINMIGEKYGHLTVISESWKDAKGESYVLCRCDCGGEKTVKGRFLRSGNCKRHCGCLDKPKKPKKIKRKPIDREQMAKDMYCWSLDGWSLRYIAEKTGFGRGAEITRLFMDHIPGYREESEKRRAKSKWARNLTRNKKKSEKFRLEKDLQFYCVRVLKDRGVNLNENDRTTTGYEIDIKTNTHCYELKVTTVKKDIYRAIGQLKINSKLSTLKPVLVIPSDTTIHEDLYQIVKDEGIVVCNETNI